MNLAIIKKDSNEITYFILDCVKTADNDYLGSNINLSGLKPIHWDFIWTNDIDGNKSADKIIPAPIFMGQYAGSKADVNKIIVDEIRKKYTIDDEMQMARVKETSPDKWSEYNEYVESIVMAGKQFKEMYFNG